MAVIQYVKGDLTKPLEYLSEEHLQHNIILGHSTNALGIMGGGVALSIRKQFPDVYAKYVEYCKTIANKETNNQKFGRVLGSAQILVTDSNPNLYIANLFGQLDIGTHKRQTNYEWLYQAITELFFMLQGKENFVIAFPYKLGCGLGGGNWEVVEAMLKALHFQYTPETPMYIVEFSG